MRLYLVGLVLALSMGCSKPRPRVVLYCAQDREFAEDLLAEFSRQHGHDVAPRFDTEADKSVSLYVELVREKRLPRCGVFWNNEILSTMRLQQQGLLEPYVSPAARGLPEWARDKEGAWHAFGDRARVLIVNTDLVEIGDRPNSLLDLERGRWQGQVVMARPQFGTSATQAACLFAALGAAEARRHYRALKANEVQLAPGNKQVAEWVARGRSPGGQTAAVGVTDTDDAIAEVKAGRPVAILFPDQAGKKLGTLFIPNTLALIKDGPNPEGGRKLIDFLLSPEVAQQLAAGPSHQFPLHEGLAVELPEQLMPGRRAVRMKVDFEQAASMWDEVQTFLRNEFARP